MKNIFKVQILPKDQKEAESSSTIIISSELQKQTNTTNGQKITLKTGKRVVDCIIHVANAIENSSIYCPVSILDDLLLPKDPFNIQIKIDPTEGIWEIGPFVGIVTDYIHHQTFGTIHTFIEELQKYGSELHIFVYVFHYDSFQNDSVNGFMYSTANKNWIKEKLPIPHVVHNRIHSRLKERSEKAQAFFQELNKTNIPYFNERFLNKWHVYEVLSSYEHLLPYLPETKLVNGRKTIEEMMNKHILLFLKPVHGSLGKNIFKIETEEESIFLDYSTFSSEIAKQYSSIPLLYDAVKHRLQKQRYIIQQGLELLLYEEERPLDFRLLCHRKSDTEWIVTSIVARVSSKNEFVSNIARGGELFKINKALNNHFDKKTIIQIERLLKEIAIEASSIIDQNAEGIYGELGVDLAVDQDGKPWIIEVNTKPSKNQDPEGFSPKIRPSAKAILNYCFHLSSWKK
ncbi:MAG TPA: YheC/YheD family protein [Bacillus bacterium]|nr:YheC/YheD family protein [Bacillus sp. (in: firmicutes)]